MREGTLIQREPLVVRVNGREVDVIELSPLSVILRSRYYVSRVSFASVGIHDGEEWGIVYAMR